MLSERLPRLRLPGRQSAMLAPGRIAAFALTMLVMCSITLAEPVEGLEPRKPRNDEELRYWLENMIWYHGFNRDEIKAATGLSDDELTDAVMRFEIGESMRPEKFPEDRLLMLPWPGGRVVSNWGGELERTRQRETKATLFTPWDPKDYVTLDVPEAIWSQFGLVYLAHVDVPTIWTRKGVTLEKMEWTRRKDGGLELHRKMPNGLEFRTVLLPFRGSLRMKITLVNGTKDNLTDLRVQNCLFLKAIKGLQNADRPCRVASSPYHAYGTADGKRWVVTAWLPVDRIWANPVNPCFHSDPKFDDCPAGESRLIYGWLSFHEGEDIEKEFKRIDKTGWQTDRWEDTPHWSEESGQYGP